MDEEPAAPPEDAARTVEVRHNPGRRRYEAWVDGVRAGRSEYLLDDGVIVFLHTEVVPRLRGRGIASALIRGALDHVRAEGTRSVVARCPKVRSWVAKHADYQDLLRRDPSRT